MTNLWKRLAIFVAGLVLIITVIDLFSLTRIGDDILGRFFFCTGYRRIGSGEICPAIKKAETGSTHTKIVLGDSVCHQIFEPFADDNSDYLLLGTNQAITMDGQYILARLFLDSHPNATEIYLVMLPGSFSTDYSSEMSYSYLIEPFGRTGTLEYLSDKTLSDMNALYGNVFLNSNVIRYIDDSSINNKVYLYYNQNRVKNRTAITGGREYPV